MYCSTVEPQMVLITNLWSRNGLWLAFIRRELFKTSLFLHELATGNEFRLWDGLDFDQQESSAPAGVYPSYAFLPEDSAIIVWSKGKIHKVMVTDGSTTEIPFTFGYSFTSRSYCLL